MTINNNDDSSWRSLPADLQTLLSDVQQGAFPYPERESAWQQVMKYLQNGNYFMAKHTLEEIQSRQDSLRQGIPAELQQLAQAVQADAVAYPERESAWQQMMKYLQNGNVFMAKHTLEEIQSRQDSLRQGIPAELQQLEQAVQANAVAYPERENAWQQVMKYLQNGNVFMAKHTLEEIQSRQDSLRQGIPAELQQLMQAVQANAVAYPERENAWQQVMKYLQNGNVFMAKHTLEEIQTRQDNLRQ